MKLKYTLPGRPLIISIGIILLFPSLLFAQLPRERAVADRPVDNIFWATSNIGINTVRNLSANNLNSTVLHTFGPVRGGFDSFFGMDDGANTRIGIDYGITDRLSAGVGRMTFNKIVDLKSKYNILRQTESGSRPVDLAIQVSAGINTTSGIGLEHSERMSYLFSFMIARKTGDLSFQASPMLAHFNNVPAEFPQQLFGLGILANYAINHRFALSAEYLPVFGERNPGTNDAMGVSLNIDTGGHIFQLFFSSSQWHNEQFIMANNRDKFWEGDFRFGFNIHRVFGLN